MKAGKQESGKKTDSQSRRQFTCTLFQSKQIFAAGRRNQHHSSEASP
ncbi:hypothetical protein WJ0W_003861 [Paenibacillus melissococcoides]|uniref:Uncharacterized protein n=1 Tax=Paenibacillus melissococcoides TaxID=2912268 RepID=A0ABM9G4I1_9BACL|nr:MULTISPECIES: hypothetical protein [Paenibacillus]MEB9894516.1 hypothetical protein [Bacillus cereus]CAH8246627.1 hypothetical protein WJ0W_003861 [Paenibacillus melissococcoides]CAH8715303.1 hypothetical protein HTL2_004230 [Paenibacillus melissococcoides]CAH8716235.1 hypothetical protein WDD9_004497 [Paenibacillus melissococcoides]